MSGPAAHAPRDPSAAPGDGQGNGRGDGRGGHRRAGWSAPVEMHTPTSPRTGHGNRVATYGLGDLDGDGRADLVEVRTDGRVTAELTWLGHRTARVAADPTLRLQALPDLDGDGRAEVLVASTASGCCQAYRLPDTRSTVLVLSHGHLRPLHWAAGGLAIVLFDRGRGDRYAGVRCDGGGLHLLEALDGGAATLLTDTTVSLTGDLARRGPPTQRTIPSGTARAQTRSRCPGLDAQGWAA